MNWLKGDPQVSKFIYQIHPYLWYFAGSLCFAIGTAIVILRMWRGK